MSTPLFCHTNSVRQSVHKSHLLYKLLTKHTTSVTPVLVAKAPSKQTTLTPLRCASSGKSPVKMLAWQIHQYGDNSELTLSDRARVATIKAPNELLIKVHAASVNPIDFRMRGGYGSKAINMLRKRQGGMIGSEFPLILGRDFSGTVIETGRAVRNFKPGDEVWGALNSYRQGSHAEFVVASQSEISKKPKSLSHVEAASIPYVAATTWSAVCTVGELKEKNAAGKRVLIQGGSGGIGSFSIQLLKAWGANVTTTCSTDAVGFVEGLGADNIVDYTATDAKRELTRHAPFDFILDAVGKSTADASFPLLKKWTNAKLVTIVTPLMKNTDAGGLVPGLAQSALSLGSNVVRGLTGGQSYRWAFFLANGKALSKVADLADKGQIQPVVEREFSFLDLPLAFETLESGHNRGKTVIRVIDSS